jgi:molybdopterin/thiamine biosynthesis adenylyltransferase
MKEPFAYGELWRPVRVDPSQIDALAASHPELATVDTYKQNLEDLFLLRNPKYRFDKNYASDFEAFYHDLSGGKSEPEMGTWFYFPWINTLVHYLEDGLHQELRTGRNKNLINQKEQNSYYRATVAILGMSVGSHVAATIAMNGGAKHLRLADPDFISGDNLNRIRTGYPNVGVKKAVVVSRQIFEMNPYADIRIYTEGITEANANEILEGATIIVEEMDNPFFKIKTREIARVKGIPVVMGTDNGDGVIVDIERFDLDRARPILHGKIGSMTSADFKNIAPRDLPKIAAKIAGAEIAVPRMLESVAEVGKSLYSWPQLGTAANMCGTVMAYLTRRIVCRDRSIRSGRYRVDLDSIFEAGYKRRWLSRKIAFVRFVKKMSKK